MIAKVMKNGKEAFITWTLLLVETEMMLETLKVEMNRRKSIDEKENI